MDKCWLTGEALAQMALEQGAPPAFPKFFLPLRGLNPWGQAKPRTPLHIGI